MYNFDDIAKRRNTYSLKWDVKDNELPMWVADMDFKCLPEISEAIKKIVEQFGDKAKDIFKSITADNGSEFASLAESVPFADVYFAHPYSSFERGNNEKQNSLLRRFFPKGKSLENVSDEAIQAAQDWINNLPRKIFDYSCSNDLFQQFVNIL